MIAGTAASAPARVDRDDAIEPAHEAEDLAMAGLDQPVDALRPARSAGSAAKAGTAWTMSPRAPSLTIRRRVTGFSAARCAPGGRFGFVASSPLDAWPE